MTKVISTSAAHTAGPWHVDRQSQYSKICIKPLPGRVVCDIDGDDAEAEANAHLIASAPELLSVCKEVLGNPNLDDMTAVKLLSEAIGKAEGR